MKKISLMILLLAIAFLYSCNWLNDESHIICAIGSRTGREEVIVSELDEFYRKMEQCESFSHLRELRSSFAPDVLKMGHLIFHTDLHITKTDLYKENNCMENIQTMSCDTLKRVKNLSEIDDCFYFEKLDYFLTPRDHCIRFYSKACKHLHSCIEEGKSEQIPECHFKEDGITPDKEIFKQLCNHLPDTETFDHYTFERMNQIITCNNTDGRRFDRIIHCPQSYDDFFTLPGCDIYRSKDFVEPF